MLPIFTRIALSPVPLLPNVREGGCHIHITSENNRLPSAV